MDNSKRSRSARGLAAKGALITMAIAAMVTVPSIWAANTGTTELLKVTGSGAPLEFGDFVTNSSASGLDTYYSVFFEIPVGLSQFEVDLFDADILNGDPSPSIRDRARGGGTAVQYRLYDPNGVLAASLDCDDTTCADNAWTNLATLPTTAPGDFVLDQFGSVAYNNNNGTVNWSTNWTETNDNGQPGSGEIQVTADFGGVLRISDNGGAPSTVTRGANLTALGFSTAELSFRWRTSTSVDGNDSIAVQAFGNGNGWTTLETFVGEDTTFQTETYDISAYLGTDTAIRFIRVNAYAGNNEYFYVADVQIQTEGSPLAVASGHWELQIDQSSAITAGDDINGLGIRVHDGDPSAGGTEINAYMQSFAAYGSNDPANARNYRHYPYVTSGCAFDVDDFDWDSVGSIQATSPSTAFSQVGTVSGNDVWATNNVAGFTSFSRADEYGLWELLSQISGPAGAGGNYATLYTADFNSAGTPPTSQPEANAYRIYLPADGADGNTVGGVPGKFVLSQVLAFSSGSNPPTPGNPGRYGITLIAENPASASGDVTFDSTNLITATVPGGNVVYVAGSAQTDTGTVGFAGGNVEWNPGVLAPGDVASMWYQIDVTDDNSLSIVATGTPGSNGTSAVYTDETGELNQEWSEGLCELVIDLQGPTAVTLRSFEAFVEDGSVIVEWATDAEAGTIGFDLWRLDSGRRDYVKVNQQPLTGLLSAPQGGVYRLRDDRAPTRGELTYMLVETESLGRERVYGPFDVEIDWQRRIDSTSALGSGDYTKAAHVSDKPALRRPIGPARAGSPPNETVQALKIGVVESGLYRVELDAIAAGLGISVAEASAHLSSRQFSLSQGLEAVGWFASEDGQALEFFGEQTESSYSAQNVYRLEVSGVSGPRRTPVAGRGSGWGSVRPPVPVGSSSAFRDTVRVDKNLFPVLVLPLPEGADFWFWDYVRFNDPSHESKPFTLDLPGVAERSPAQGSLTVHLQGGGPGQHELELFLNGTWIGYAALDDHESTTFTTRFFSQRLLNDGPNTLELVAVNGGLVFLDWVEVEFDRLYDAGSDGFLHHRGADNKEVTVTGFSSPDIRVFDLTNPRQPRLRSEAVVQSVGASFSVTYSPKSGDAVHLAVGGGGVQAPVSLVPDYSSDLRSPQQGADYLILTTAEMVEVAGSLAAHRQSQWHTTMVIDVADVYDEFSAGAVDPRAIRDFLAYAYGNWSVSPRYVLLAANGTWDYKDHLGFGDNLVPPMFRTASGDAPGLYATDYPFGDVDGDDDVWEIAVGRVSVTSPVELQSYIDKIVAFENDFDGGPRDSVLLLSDNPDSSGDYATDAARLAGLLPLGMTPLSIELNPSDVDSSRALLFDALELGVPLMTYNGHAGMTVLAHEGVLTTADLPALANQGRAPILNAVTCFVASFANPGFDSLGEGLVNHPQGGAAAIWASLYFASNTQTQFLADRFFRQVFHEHEAILGDAVLRTVQGAADDVSRATLRRTAILGDPALRFQHQPVSVPPETTPGE